jgi:hypothetical protein
VKVLRTALDAHLTLITLDPDDPDDDAHRIAASTNLLRIIDLLQAQARHLDEKIESQLRSCSLRSLRP